MMTVSKMTRALALPLAAAVCMTACTSTSQMRKTKASGFLGDYSSLREGAAGEAQLVYINPKAKWAGYRSLMIDPIKAYAIPGNPLAELPKDQLNALVAYLDSSLRERLGQDFKIVRAAGPGVLRLRVALTEAEAGAPVRGVVSSVMPVGVALSALKTAATGQGSAVGSARVEMELVDAQTRERLMAAVDAQAGNKRDFFGSFSKWDDAQDAFDQWSAKLQQRLRELRAGGM